MLKVFFIFMRYAAAGMWEEHKKVSENIRDRQLVKIPGYIVLHYFFSVLAIFFRIPNVIFFHQGAPFESRKLLCATLSGRVITPLINTC